MTERMADDSDHRSPDDHDATGWQGLWLKYFDWILILTVGTVLAADQISKQIVESTLQIGESWPREGLFRLTHGTNTGSAFGLFPNQTVILTIASVLAIGFIFYYYKTHDRPRNLIRLAIGLQLGGALGNLIDRLTVGAVTDFIDVGRWPIFNLADSSIVVGMILLVSLLTFGETKSKSSDAPPTPPPLADASDD